jgi:hypothetical protein
MIELIFAIVIMGIVLMSAPQLISQANKGGYLSMQQEGIAAAASHLSFILTQHWDEANVAQVPGATILGTDTSEGIKLARFDSATPYRSGTPTVGTHRTLTDNAGEEANATIALGRDGTEASPNDIDDYDQTDATLSSVSGADNGANDYIDKQMTMATTVQYVDDTPTNIPHQFNHNEAILTYNIPNTQNLQAPVAPAKNSNIKWVSVVLNEGSQAANTEITKTITLHAFSCNIGGYRFKSVDYD